MIDEQVAQHSRRERWLHGMDQVLDRVRQNWREPRRPLRARVWFTRPQWHWFGWRTLYPWMLGKADEYDWHCVEFGWTITGRVAFAVRPCPGLRGWRRKCREHEEAAIKYDGGLSVWPHSQWDTYMHTEEDT